MKRLSPKQKSFMDMILQDSKKIPKFIDTKREDHKQAILIMQSIYENISFLASDMFLSDHCISACESEVVSDLNKIEDWDLCLDIHAHLLHKMVKYQKLAIDYECYEAASNLKKFLR